MLLFCLENKKDEGVYSRGFGYKVAEAAIERGEVPPTQHVGPEDDSLLREWWTGRKLSKKAQYVWEYRDRREWYFAFESLDQLKQWFPLSALKDLKALCDKHGDTMALSVYEVNGKKTKKGETQILFHMPSAQFVERISLEELIQSF